MARFNGFLTKKTLLALALGQFISLLNTSTGFASSELARRGINAPTSQSMANYVLLAIVYGSIMIYRKTKLKELHPPSNCLKPLLRSDVTKYEKRDIAKWYYYLLLALVDVEANFLVVKAYQYTSLTSVMLLDCWTIPSVIFLTWFFLNEKYRYRKIAGVAVCVAGLVSVVFSDVHAKDRAGGSNPVKGDLIVIAGATLYAVSNVSEEFLVKNAERVELMAMLGLFGAIISGCQISILERQELQSIHWSVGAVLPFVGFAAAMFLFYSSVPILLKISGSTMLNLSLLTADMWTVLIRIFAYHEKVDWMYYVAFGAVAVGLVIYSGSAKEEGRSRTQAVGDAAEQSKERDVEVGIGTQDQGPKMGSSKRPDVKHDSTSSVPAATIDIGGDLNSGKDSSS